MDQQAAAVAAACFIVVAAVGGIVALVRLAVLAAHDTAGRDE